MDQLNNLAKRQETCGQTMAAMLANLKKEASSRRSIQFYEDSKTLLNKSMQEVEKNHKSLTTIAEEEDLQDKHEYFTTDYFNQIASIYKDTKKYIADCTQKLELCYISDDDPKQIIRLKEQYVRMEEFEELLQEVEENLLESKPKIKYDRYLKEVSGLWEGIHDLNREIRVNESEFTNKYFTDNKFKDVKQKYREVSEKLEETCQKLSSSPESMKNKSNPTNIKLPTIKIPFFEGKYEDWTTFQDIFLKIVHSNESLSAIEKMQFLKTQVRGEASKVIQHFQISEANYEVAWTQLQQRYNNERLILDRLIYKILNLPAVPNESAEKLRNIYDTITECLEAIRVLNIDTTTWGPIISCIIASRWDAKTNELYEASLANPTKIQKLADVQAFLLRRFQALESTVEAKKKEPHPNKIPNSNTKRSNSCKYCNLPHMLYQCLKFKALSGPERFSFVKEKKICTNCLNHDSSQKCNSQMKCQTCHQQHHTLLHKDSNQKSNVNKNNTTNTSNNASKVVGHVSCTETESVLLATALIKFRNATGSFEYLRALVDSGSQASFITKEAATLLGLPKQRVKAEITGLGAGQVTNCNFQIQAMCVPRIPSEFCMSTNLLILPTLTGKLPEHEIQVNMDVWQNKILADPTFFKTGPIDVLLGAREYRQFLRQGIHKTDDGLLGQDTEFGWIVYGSIFTNPPKDIKIVSMITQTVQDQQLAKFWEMDENTSTKEMTEQEAVCEELYQKTTKRNQDGKYTVSIPFKNNIVLGNSRPRAMARLLQLEKRLARNSKLDTGYKQFMQEYLDLGHMEKVPRSKENQGKYYIPHQAVIKESSSTTKLRVVFDASCKTSNGICLNEIMHVGNRLQQDLSDILLRWRSYPIVFTADIEKMYRQIMVQESDQDYQRILWRFNLNDPIREYKLCTVTYGTAAAPYLAVRTIQQLAKDEMLRYPDAAKVTLRDFYVDDLLSGAFSIEEAIHLREQLINMFEAGGLLLRKWSSNNTAIIEDMPDNMRDQSTFEFTEDENITKSLGINWAPADDTIRFRVNTSEIKILTKRAIISEAARIFDPLGWLSPVVILAKLLIQELWLKNLSWDEEVPASIKERWEEYSQGLKNLRELRIPRWTYLNTHCRVELHGFSDASEKAYGAVVYIKTVNDSGESHITMLTSKSKVAPAKTKITLPRLELCAAVLLAKLLQKVIVAFDFKNETNLYAWTDSMITLCWIKGEATKWKTFVANRVSEINKLIPMSSWHHVKSEDNPADGISRGINPSKLESHVIWWCGPSWLKDDTYDIQPEIPQETDELRKCYRANIGTVATITDNEICAKFSSIFRMIRVIAQCNRFIGRCQKQTLFTDRLKTEELNKALLQVTKMEQTAYFKQEIDDLRKKGQVKKDSRISNLTPFMDSEGILRVGGRLHHSLLPYTVKHPAILPGDCHLTRLIIREAHEATLHGGNQLTLSQTRKKYWIINGKKAVKKEVNKCVKCLRFKAETSKQLMGQLPAARVTPSSAFTHTGIDYAGPIQIRTTKGRGHKSHKGYIAIFVCFTTKAIHLEVVSDMTSESFLAALKRFMSRRGPCAHIYSDNGTTFLGTQSIIENEVKKMIESSDIADKSTVWGVQWHFIPPATPHFGGLWEAAVKSTKYHLKRIIGETTLTYEEMSTLTQQIEATLNSRPLCALTEEINDVTVLTPGHFLIGKDLMAPANPVVNDVDADLVGRWKIMQKMKKEFWKVWSLEYLQQLQQSYKWKSSQGNLAKGDVVLVKDDNIKASSWPLARITEVHPDHEGKVRVVTVRKSGGTILKRPIHKLIYLPTSDEVHQHSTDSSTQPKKEKAPSSRWKILLVAILFMTTLSKSSASLYNVEYPPPGMYIEHIGDARIDRGTFRIELKFNKTTLYNDAKNIGQTVSQMERLCNNSVQVSVNIECTSIINQLRDKEKQMDWVRMGIQTTTNERQKRGLLGTFMTSIFGVNDEAYQDIETLEKNQQQLIQSSSHQTKFMLQALSTFNETETRVYTSLNHFKKKLNQALDAINEMQRWYKSIDENKLSIHLLSTFQLANNYLDEMLNHYRNILGVQYNTGNLYQFITPAHVEEILKTSSRNLPSNLQILSHPILRSNVEHSKEYIHLYGYFAITEVTKYMMIKVTPIPFKVENGYYWTLETTNTVIAINYDVQQYFQLSEEEFQQNILLSKNSYICFPSIIRNIDTNPNCVIDEIYKRTENSSCPVNKRRIKSLVWRQLYTINTWLFISPEVAKIALTCNGNREDIKLNKTGIITISQNCIIVTKKTIVTPRRNNNIPVLAAFARPVAVNLTTSANTFKPLPLDEETIMISDTINDLVEQENSIQFNLQETHWERIHHQSILTSCLTSIIIVTSLIAILYGTSQAIKIYRRKRDQPKTSTEDKDEERGIELKPLRRKGRQDST